jgi:hypothetical protein
MNSHLALSCNPYRRASRSRGSRRRGLRAWCFLARENPIDGGLSEAEFGGNASSGSAFGRQAKHAFATFGFDRLAAFIAYASEQTILLSALADVTMSHDRRCGWGSSSAQCC